MIGPLMVVTVPRGQDHLTHALCLSPLFILSGLFSLFSVFPICFKTLTFLVQGNVCFLGNLDINKNERKTTHLIHEHTGASFLTLS